MADTTFVNKQTVVQADWLNDVNISVYKQITSIAQLRTQLKTGPSKVAVLGYYAKGDGGGGLYFYDSADTTSPDNAGTVIVASDGGRWKLQHNGTVTAKQFGAKGDGITDDTASLTKAINFVFPTAAALYIPAGVYLVSDILTVIDGIRLTVGGRIYGDGKNVTVLKSNNTVTSVWTLTTSNPSSVPISVQTSISGISFFNLGHTKTAVTIRSLAMLKFEDCQADGFAIGLDAQSSLIMEFHNCTFSDNTRGVKMDRYGSSGTAYCNLITFYSCKFNGNPKYGADMDRAVGIHFENCDIEENGTFNPTGTPVFSGSTNNITWTGHGLSGDDPVVFSTTGTMPSGLTAGRIYYAAPVDANTIIVAATPGGAALAPGGTGTGTHTAISPNSGAIKIGRNVLEEVGISDFTFKNCWFEGNYGAAIQSMYSSSALGLTITIEGGHCLGRDGGRTSLLINNAMFVSIRDFKAVAGQDYAYIRAGNLEITNSYFINMLRPEMYANREFASITNSWINGAHHTEGEYWGFQATLSGMTTTVNVIVQAWVQLGRVSMRIGPNTGTSNTTTMTITNIPVALRPPSTRGGLAVTVDNGTNALSTLSVDSSGTITFNRGIGGGSFTASGTKGIVGELTISYDV